MMTPGFEVEVDVGGGETVALSIVKLKNFTAKLAILPARIPKF